MYKKTGVKKETGMGEEPAGGPKMKSGFKMKSGSPFQRNFGIGASPVKAAAKPDYPDIDGDGNTTESMKEAAADKKDDEAGGPQMQSPMKRVGEYIDVLDEEGNIKSTKRVTEGMGEGSSVYRRNVARDTRGDKFYTQAEKNIQKQIDEGTITPEEGEMISTDAATYGTDRKYKKQRRLTGIDLKMEKLRNLRASYEDAGESFEEAKNTPEYKAKMKEINKEYEQYKKDNPDTWEQDLAVYQNRIGEDYDYSQIPKSRDKDGGIVYSPYRDEAMKADLCK